MEKLYFASHNKHKADEVGQMLADQCEVVLSDNYVAPAEDADSLEGNAFIKADALYALAGGPCMADDTGLFVEQLDGAPGIYSARYAGDLCNDADNRRRLTDELKLMETPHRAYFQTVIAFIDKQGDRHAFRGRVDGQIILDERGEQGFGYDPIFVPEGYDQTFAEMEATLKNRLSHRYRAIKELKLHLIKNAL